MVMINVLYSDDVKPNDTFFDQAILAEFNVDWVETWEEAYYKLLAEKGRYEAVILDAKGQLNTNSAAEDPRHLKQALSDIKDLIRNGHDLCSIIYSGNPDIANIFETENEPYVPKSKGARALFDELEKLVKSKDSYILKQRHPVPFKVFEKDFLNKKYEKTLIKLINGIDAVTEVSKMEETLYNPCRTLLEGVFHSLIDCGAVPEKFRPNGIVNNNAARLLLTKESAYVPPDDSRRFKTNLPLPVRISNEIEFLLDNTNPDSHYNYNLNSEVAQYAIGSIINQLLDVLCWLFEFRTKNPDKKQNERLWEEISDEVLFVGTLEKDDDGNYYCGDFALNNKRVQGLNLSTGTAIKVTAAQPNTNNSTCERYPQFAYRFTVG